MYTTLDEFISEIASAAVFKDNPHLIDKPSIARWVYLKLKNFGRAVMSKHEIVVQVNKHKAILPENFASLGLAVFCEPLLASYPEGTDFLKVQSRLIGERLTCFEDRACENCEPTCDSDECQERIVENLYMESTPIKLYYTNPQYVKIGRGFTGNQCETNCMNRYIKDSPFSINLNGNEIIANFEKGALYIQYYGSPMDEYGLPIIPNSKNGYLEEYLEYHVLRKILEYAQLSGDMANKQYLYQSYMQQENDLRLKAHADISPVDMVALFKNIGENRQRMRKFDINLGTIKTNYQESGIYAGRANDPNPFKF